MLDALKFVQGAVARKDFVPALQHFRIQNGLIKSFNGTLGLCSPIPVTLDLAPHADSLVRAIEACPEGSVAALSVTDKGRLLVRAGDFKTFVDTVDPTTFPPYEPEGKRVTLNQPILSALKYLQPFIAEDASRQWACGILFSGQSAFATNNVVLQEYWLGTGFPVAVNIPGNAVRELLRIGVEPESIQMSEVRITFHYPEGRWLTTQLYEAQWPDLEPLLSRESQQAPFPEGFFEALERILPFTDDINRVYFAGDRLATSPEPDAAGTTISLPGIPATGCFNARQLMRLREVAQTIDFTAYPEPSMFYGEASRGIICGLRT